MRIRLRTLLIIVALIAACLAMVVMPIQESRRERAIMAELEARHGANSALSGATPYWWSGLAKHLGIGPVHQLTCVELQDCKGVSDVELKDIARLPHLLVFNLWNPEMDNWDPRNAESKITDAGLAKLASCSQLAALSLAGSDVTDEGVKHIGKLRQMRFLGLYGMTKITDRGVANLGSLTRLESLNLEGSSVTNLKFGFLSPECPLTKLRLRDTKLTDEGLKAIAGFKSLRELWLHSTAITDEGLKSLEGLSSLEELSLYNTQITDKGITSLIKLPLIQLSLWKTAVTEKGVAQLILIPTLRSLMLSETILDAKVIPILCKMQQLDYLGVEGTRITLADLIPLQQKFPGIGFDITP